MIGHTEHVPVCTLATQRSPWRSPFQPESVWIEAPTASHYQQLNSVANEHLRLHVPWNSPAAQRAHRRLPCVLHTPSHCVWYQTAGQSSLKAAFRSGRRLLCSLRSLMVQSLVVQSLVVRGSTVSAYGLRADGIRLKFTKAAFANANVWGRSEEEKSEL